MRQAVGDFQLSNLNVGAGDQLLVNGYVHIDACYSDNFLQQHENDTGIGFIKCDVVGAFPRLQNVQTIYSSHLLEHLSADNGVTLLNNFYNVLSTGGIVRICVPDFNIWLQKFKDQDHGFFEFYRSNMPYQLSEVYQDDFAFMTTMIYGHGHNMVYTNEYLTKLLAHAGFKNIQTSSWGQSSIPHIELLESASNILRSTESLIVEATK